jgi:hypothetical protein
MCPDALASGGFAARSMLRRRRFRRAGYAYASAHGDTRLQRHRRHGARILALRSTAAGIALWSASVQAGSPLIQTISAVCERVPDLFGFEGLQAESIWPQPYQDLDKTVQAICDLAAEKLAPDSDRIFALAADEFLERDWEPVSDDEAFDVRNAVKERAAARDASH